MYVILRPTFVRALRTVCLVTSHIKDGALDGQVDGLVRIRSVVLREGGDGDRVRLGCGEGGGGG